MLASIPSSSLGAPLGGLEARPKRPQVEKILGRTGSRGGVIQALQRDGP